MKTDDFVSDAQTESAATPCSSISAMRFGREGMLGVQGGELPVGDHETTDARASTIRAPRSS